MKMKVSREYVDKLQERYELANRSEKKIILDEFTKTNGYDRKYAIKLLSRWYIHTRGMVRRPRSVVYTREDARILSTIAELFDWICSKRLKPVLSHAIDELQNAGKITINDEQKERLGKISAATIDRLLTRYHLRPTIRGRSYTKSGTLLKSKIPIRIYAAWDEDMVGFMEIDLVGHDGGNIRGDFSWTLNCTDVKTGWSEQMAVYNKAQMRVFAALKDIRSRLPFPLKGIDSDSGGEFINDQLYRYCVAEHITFTRGRPGKKTDNAYVEQKNDSIVRRWIGYGRYDTQKHVELLNELYTVLRLYLNYFVPVMKLKKKVYNGSRITKIYDTPKTPYARVLEADDVPTPVKEMLKKHYATLSILSLKSQLNSLVKKLNPSKVR